MRVLVDTNILLDWLTGREPYYSDADEIVKLCSDKLVEGVVAAHSVPNMFYILRKRYSEKERRELLLGICDIFQVEGIDASKLVAALKNNDFSDLEDCLQCECAKSVNADYIVTRNTKDFKNSEIAALMPEEMLEIVKSQS